MDLQQAIRLHQAGQLAQAEAIYRQLLAVTPNHPQLLFLLGTVAGQTGRTDESIALLQRAAALSPQQPLYHNNLGNALKEKGRLEEAIAAYRQAIALSPNAFPPHNNLANVLLALGRNEEALAAINRALQINPDNPEARNNLGTIYLALRRYDEAAAAFRRALQLAPALADAHNNLGYVYKEMGQFREALASFREALRIQPLSLWARSNLIFTMHYDPDSTSAAIAAEARQFDEIHGTPLRSHARPHKNAPDPNRVLRVGFIGSDFCLHPVGRFLLPLFAQLDRSQIELHVLAAVDRPDAMTQRLRSLASHWHDVSGQTPDVIAQRVRDAGIDILVDLSGHTHVRKAHLLVFAHKPAPVQLTWLGFPGTTGLSSIDYRLTDSLADPPGMTESFHSEKLWRLPETAWCYPTPESPAPIAYKPAHDGTIRFGSFNNFAKLNAPLIALWAQILNQAPCSRLLIKAHALDHAPLREQLLKEFQSLGIAANRVEFKGWLADAASHLAAYNAVDIALDTYPYHGTTTTCDALYMGVPVVTLAGPAHVSRVGVSLLTQVGLADQIAQTPEEYVRKAVALAQDAVRLQELRQTLRPRMQASPLMDAPRFARHMEAALRGMWRIWCQTHASP